MSGEELKSGETQQSEVAKLREQYMTALDCLRWTDAVQRGEPHSFTEERCYELAMVRQVAGLSERPRPPLGRPPEEMDPVYHRGVAAGKLASTTELSGGTPEIRSEDWEATARMYWATIQRERAEHEAVRKETAMLRKQKDGAYRERNQLVALLARMALTVGYKAGIALHPESDTSWEKDWRTVAFVELPTGQCAWHFHDSEVHLFQGLPFYSEPWDGHSTEEKYDRVNHAFRVGTAQVASTSGVRDEHYQLCKLLGPYALERGKIEGTVEVLERLLKEVQAARTPPQAPPVSQSTRVDLVSGQPVPVEAMEAQRTLDARYQEVNNKHLSQGEVVLYTLPNECPNRSRFEAVPAVVVKQWSDGAPVLRVLGVSQGEDFTLWVARFTVAAAGTPLAAGGWSWRYGLPQCPCGKGCRYATGECSNAACTFEAPGQSQSTRVD